MGVKVFVFGFHNQLEHRRQFFLIYPALKYFYTNEMDKLLENLCENLQTNQSFFAPPRS